MLLNRVWFFSLYNLCGHFKCNDYQLGCKTGYGKSKPPEGVTRHVFPKDPVMREKWIKSIPRSDWSPAPSAVICSLHFQQSDFKTAGKLVLQHFFKLGQIYSNVKNKKFDWIWPSNSNKMSLLGPKLTSYLAKKVLFLAQNFIVNYFGSHQSR